MYWKNRTWLVRRLREPVAVDGQDARFDGLSRRDAETLANWTEAARERGAVLFVGAGWTANAESAPRRHDEHGQRVPAALLWNQLAVRLRDALSADLGDNAPADPLWLAELYRQRFGSDALFRLVAEAVPDEQLQPGPLFDALRSVNWHTVLTTNYDTLLERTFQPHRRVHVCVDDPDLVRSASATAMELIHLHGVLQRPDTIVLAYEDYRKFPQKRPGLLAKVRQLFLQHPVLFVGFGVTDPNFLQWAGWLTDIVGEHRNPWVNLTLDPAPEVPHARYWSSRLEFVSIGDLPRFRAVAPELLRVLGEALGKDPLSKTVARLRVADTRSASELVAETEKLLRTGQARGLEGPEWDRFCDWLFDAAASHLLDVSGEKWSEPSPTGQEARTRLSIEIDMRPLTEREQNEQLVATLRRTFGPQWEPWRKLLANYLGDAWDFHRVDLRNERHSNVWNHSVVSLRDGEATRGGDASNVGSGDTALDSLRIGRMPTAQEPPTSAQQFRLVGYVAYQLGDLERAAGAYRRAVAESRKEREPLRVEWLTLASLHRCLDHLSLRGADATAETRAERDRTVDDLSKLSEVLSQLPRGEGRDPLRDYESSCLEKLVDQLVEDIDQHDVDGTMRHGRIFGDADTWLDVLERVWVAPPLACRAAGCLGALQWRYGAITDAVRTLSRYGSPRLAKFVSATVQAADVKATVVAKAIPLLLEHGRWPGEWLAKAEALVPLVPWCTVTELDALGEFVVAARVAVIQHDEVYRGGKMVFSWVARSTIEKLEAARWAWLSPASALQAVERWIEELPGIDEATLAQSGAIRALDRLPWARWAEQEVFDSARATALFARLLDGRSAAPREHIFNDLEILIERVVYLIEKRVITPPHETPLGVLIERSVRTLPDAKQDIFVVRLSQVDSNAGSISTLVAGTLADADLEDRASLRHALEVVGTAATCPDDCLPKLALALQRLTQHAADGLSGAFRNRRGIDDARLVAFVVTRLLIHNHGPRRELVSTADRILNALPATAEYLMAVPPERLEEVGPKVAQSTILLLRAADATEDFSVMDQRYAGLRGVIRAVVQVGPHIVSPEMLLNVATSTRLADQSLAAYAARILSDWVIRVGKHSIPTDAIVLVAAALRGAASDKRVLVRSNALRGVLALNQLMPDPATAEVLAENIGDERIAIRRALEGSSDFESLDE